MHITPEQLAAIKALHFSEDSFAKFNDITHPLYPQYKDRHLEMSHDLGYNNAVEDVLNILGAPLVDEPVIQLEEPAPMPPHPCSDPELTSHCSGCTDLKDDPLGGTHQGCTIEHGHVGCNLSTSEGWPAK